MIGYFFDMPSDGYEKRIGKQTSMTTRRLCFISVSASLILSLALFYQWLIYKKIDVLSYSAFMDVEVIMLHMIKHGEVHELADVLASDLNKHLNTEDAAFSGQKRIGRLQASLLQVTGGFLPDVDQLLQGTDREDVRGKSRKSTNEFQEASGRGNGTAAGSD